MLKRRDFLKLSLLGFGVTACQWLKAPFASPFSTDNPESAPTITTLETQSGTTSPSTGAPGTVEPSPESLSTSENLAVEPETPFPTFIIDGHQDIAWNALELDRDVLQSAYLVRSQETNNVIPRIAGERVTGLPEYLAGRVGIIFASLFVSPAQEAIPGYNSMVYTTPVQAEQCAQEQLGYYRGLAEKEPRIRLITSPVELDSVTASWTQPDQQPLVGLVLLMEGADPIQAPADLPKWHQNGLRIIGPAWHATRYSAGTGKPGSLTDLGRQLLVAMAELNMILDISHLAEAAALEAVEGYNGPVIASHSNPKPFSPSDRGLPDETIKRLVARDGVEGIVFYNRYLKPGWVEGDSRQQVTLDTVVDAIDYVAQLAGDVRHVAIGSDLDGGFGLNAIPWEMDSIADMIMLAERLVKRGYSEAEVEGIMNGNWLRVLRKGLR